MTTVSSGGSSNLGGPTVPTQRDIEATAWTEVNKAALGIVADSIEKAFSDLTPRYTTGYLGGFGYRSTSSNPMLDHPLESANLAPSLNRSPSQSWQSSYQELINQLPSDLLARFMLEVNKPFDQRSPSFVALDNVLQMTAKVMTQTESLAQPTDPGSLEAAKATFNLLLPFAALKGALANGQESVQAAQDFLISKGANYPNFDGLNSILNQMQSPFSLMEHVNDSLNNSKNGQLSPQSIAASTKASQQLSALRTQMENVSLGSNLQMLLDTVGSLEMVANALSLPNTHTAPLFIALSIASTGLFTSDSPAGILGPSVEALANNLNAGVASSLIPSNNAGSELLALMTTTSLAVFSALGALALDSGLGIYPQTNPEASNAAHYFAFATALQLAVNAGVLEAFYNEAIAVSGGNPQAQAVGGSALAQAAHLMIILSGSIEGNVSPLGLIEEHAAYLSQGIAAAAIIEQAAESKQTTAAAIAFQLSSLALENQDYEGFIQALNNGLESLETSQNALENDISLINQTADTIVTTANMNSDQPLTGLTYLI